jgi:hypothetical protein
LNPFQLFRSSRVSAVIATKRQLLTSRPDPKKLEGFLYCTASEKNEHATIAGTARTHTWEFLLLPPYVLLCCHNNDRKQIIIHGIRIFRDENVAGVEKRSSRSPSGDFWDVSRAGLGYVL